MRQLELFGGLEPVREYLHEWAALDKKRPAAGAAQRAEAPVCGREEKGADKAACQRITPLSCRPGKYRDVRA